MSTLPCGCWVGPWNSILPAPMCDAHKNGWTSPPPTLIARDWRDDELVRLRAEVERLTRWQAEASAVIYMWEETWTAIGEPGQLGDRKSAAVATAFLGLRALADQLAEALRRARMAMVDYACQGTGTHPEEPDWQDFCMATWEAVPDDLAELDAALAAYEQHKETP